MRIVPTYCHVAYSSLRTLLKALSFFGMYSDLKLLLNSVNAAFYLALFTKCTI